MASILRFRIAAGFLCLTACASPYPQQRDSLPASLSCPNLVAYCDNAGWCSAKCLVETAR